MKKINGIIYGLLSGIAFGITPVFAKTAYNNGLNATTVLIFRYLLAAFILFFYCIFKRLNLKINKKQLILFLLVGMVGYTLSTETLFIAYNKIGAGLATALHFVYPTVVCVLSFFIYKEAMNKSKIIALIVSCIGVYMLVGLSLSEINIPGVILALFSGIVYSVSILGMNKKELKEMNNMVVTFYISLFAGIAILAFGVVSKGIIIVPNMEVILSLVGLSVISTILPLLFIVKAVKYVGPSTTSILATFEPIVSMVVGVFMFKEKITLSIIIGTILILISVVILAREENSEDIIENKDMEEIEDSMKV